MPKLTVTIPISLETVLKDAVAGRASSLDSVVTAALSIPMDNGITLKAAALKLGFVTEAEFDRVVDPVPASLQQLHDQ
jgi:hypothetical protein